MEFLGIRWVGVNPENGQKLLLSLAFIAIVLALARFLRYLAGRWLGGTAATTRRFWTRQGISLFAAVVLILGLLSIWFSDPTRLATALGLVSAGLAFALQQPVTAVAGYFVILRGSTFNVGDRIRMGGVRGDVIRLGFIQTTIMEMGEPPAVQGADPAMWVKSRQFTGRIVTVSNSRVFSDPVFNYTRDFPFIWEEITVPITYQADRDAVEQILLDAARRHGGDPAELGDHSGRLQARFGIEPIDLDPRVYYRITDNWLELTVRFVVTEHGIRSVKDAISRDVLQAMDARGIGIASATYDIVGLPPLRIERAGKPQADHTAQA